MRLVTLRIRSAARGLVYKRSMSARAAFESFVWRTVAAMQALGILAKGDAIAATITTGPDVRPPSTRMTLVPGGATVAEPPSAWLTLVDPPADAVAEPIGSFVLDLYTRGDNGLHYRSVFSVGELREIAERTTAALIQRGILAKDEAVQAEFVVAGAEIEEEGESVVDMPERLKTLESQISIEHQSETWPVKPMPSCPCGEADKDRGLVIFVQQRAWQDLNAYTLEHGSRRTESGGVLIGEVFRRPDSEQLYVDIDGFIAAPETQANAVSLRFTHETWQALQREKRSRYPEKQVVGWYHTHPPLRIRGVESVAFFSTDDWQMHRESFPAPWQVALVMDAESKNPDRPTDRVFYRWEGTNIVQATFHVHD